VLTHKNKISAMALAQDKFLITGDVVGVIYIWNLMSGSEDPTLKTFDLHKDKGAITNLVAIQRPLSLFGLTANMQGYEPGEIKTLRRNVTPIVG
jgi:hypothetical protein